MLYFLNDYSEGAHEKVLQHLIDTNMEQLLDMEPTITVKKQKKRSRRHVAVRTQKSFY